MSKSTANTKASNPLLEFIFRKEVNNQRLLTPHVCGLQGTAQRRADFPTRAPGKLAHFQKQDNHVSMLQSRLITAAAEESLGPGA